MFAQSSRYAFGDLREERMQQIRNNQTDKMRSAGCQCAGILVGLVIQLLDAAQDSLARLFTNVVAVMQYFRHGDRGDAEITRDILHPNRHVRVR